MLHNDYLVDGMMDLRRRAKRNWHQQEFYFYFFLPNFQNKDSKQYLYEHTSSNIFIREKQQITTFSIYFEIQHATMHTEFMSYLRVLTREIDLNRSNTLFVEIFAQELNFARNCAKISTKFSRFFAGARNLSARKFVCS